MTILRVDFRRPPGVLRRMTSAAAPACSASLMEVWMNSALAGLIGRFNGDDMDGLGGEQGGEPRAQNEG